VKGRRPFVLGALGTVAFAVAFVLADDAHGLALLAYVLFVGALVAGVLASRLGDALPRARPFDELLPQREQAHAQPVQQLEAIRRDLRDAGRGAVDARRTLVPLVRAIVAARLGRGRGVDVTLQPERARELLLGSRAWALLHDDGGPAQRWSRRELEELVGELEHL
jgi:hypothetical protein